MDTTLVDRLAAFRIFRDVPRSELEWLVGNADVRSWDAGHKLINLGEPVDEMLVLLSGHVVFYTDFGGRRRHLYGHDPGDLAGALPFSRAQRSPGFGYVEEAVECLTLHREQFPALIRECPQVTARCVHFMLDRVRVNLRDDMHDEKMASLGRLSAGLAHELNNPASAAARSAKLLGDTLAAIETTAEALATLEPRHRTVLAEARERALSGGRAPARTPLEEADRLEAFSDWLSARGLDDGMAVELAGTRLDIETLDSLANAMSPAQLTVGLRWLAATCAARVLAGEIGDATTRIHGLVSEMTRYTYMDRAIALRSVDVPQGIHDSATVLAPKARARSVAIDVDLPDELPRVHGFGDELNQVWLNLLDNAVDAAASCVTVSAAVNGELLLVRVTDDGAGIPADVQPRVFEPFFTTKPVGQGTGLGLDTVQRIVQRHQGEVSFATRTGQTEFCVALPYATPVASG